MTCTTTCIQPSPSNAHCGACHVTFGGVSAFDRHRRDGACLHPTTLPMHTDPRGVWRWDGANPHTDAPSARDSETQGGEQASLVPPGTPQDPNALETLSGGCCAYHDCGGFPCGPDDTVGGYCCDNCPTLTAAPHA